MKYQILSVYLIYSPIHLPATGRYDIQEIGLILNIIITLNVQIKKLPGLLITSSVPAEKASYYLSPENQ
jgi:hypothetical protein